MSRAIALEDEKWMRRALRLAKKGIGFTRPNPPVGAVLVFKGRCVGEGFHRQAGGAHAEVEALRSAGNPPPGTTLYVTLEPCCTQGRTPPCTAAIRAAGVRRVVVGTLDPNPRHHGRGLTVLRGAGIEVVTDICAGPAREIIRPFACWIQHGRPWITLKMALTLDGCIADRRRCSQWISGPASRRDVQGWRRRRDLVMVGVETALRDDPSLRCRSQPEPPTLRLVVDSRGRLPPSARLLNDDAVERTRIATTPATPAAVCRAWEARGATVWVLPAVRGHLALDALARHIGQESIPGVLCEGGAGLAGALVRAGLVDEFLFYLAPRVLADPRALHLLGGTGQGFLLPDAPHLTVLDVRRLGPDIRIRALSGRPSTESEGE